MNGDSVSLPVHVVPLVHVSGPANGSLRVAQLPSGVLAASQASSVAISVAGTAGAGAGGLEPPCMRSITTTSTVMPGRVSESATSCSRVTREVVAPPAGVDP
jgi:hypothetical protein